jgi:DNA-binding transcriptional LysR family regulator
MTLRELELFYYLTENPHISQLSKKIGISQSGISLAIKSLEKKLTETLFDRIGKKLILNERGRLFKEETYKHYLALKDAQNIFTTNKFSGILKVASSRTIGAFTMPSIIFNFLSKNSNIKIEKEISNSSKIVKSILEGDIDIGFIERSVNEMNLIKEKIGKDNLIIVSGDKSLANKEFYIDQLFSKKWLLREEGSGTREIFLKGLGNLAKEINIYMEFSGFVEIKGLLAKNPDAITCISRFSVEKELQTGELFEVKLKNISFDREFFVVYHKNKYQSRLFKIFKEFSKEYFDAIKKF